LKSSLHKLAVLSLSAATLAVVASSRANNDFRFVILGDRTGSAVPGVYEQVWRETDRDRPDFVISVGDTIEGGNDLAVEHEWQEVLRTILPYRHYRFFPAPGNHDVWSIASAQAFEKYTKHPLHYSFDYQQAHFTVLDNSRSDALPAAELAYLDKDLQAHQRQPLKFIFSHRPSWVLQVLLQNPDFPLHRLAKRYGVRYIIAGHVHQMLRFDLEGVTYLSMASSGGNLRDTKTYARGWFFQHTLVTVHDDSVNFSIKELGPPFGKSRVTHSSEWGAAGLAGQQ
jgi:hypothetical protein